MEGQGVNGISGAKMGAVIGAIICFAAIARAWEGIEKTGIEKCAPIIAISAIFFVLCFAGVGFLCAKHGE
ncbi:MAG: hypothetical protein AAB655_02470 [Patescibacteria group bacterium]